MLRRLLVVLAVAATMFGFTRTASAEEEIKYGTLAPADSAWGKVFKAWSSAIAEETSSNLKLTWYFNGTQGDELAMVGKMRSGQLDGGAFTTTGLNQVSTNYGVFGMPGLFPLQSSPWAKFDEVRTKMSSKFDKVFNDQGFVILGTGDVGVGHLMSRGGAVRTPDDLKKFHPFYIAGDSVGQKFLEVVGVPSPRALSVPAILPAISSRSEGAVDVLNAPAIAADQLQWQAQVDNVLDLNTGIGMGALIMKKDRYDGLPADLKAVLERTGKNTGELLTKRIRGIDAAAWERFKANKTVTTPTADEVKAWDTAFKKTRDALKAEGKFKGDVFDEVTAAAGR
jgi:TRAP-type C4-dicarboxylate transport system substrate-binding protein